jgi:hypothetical protein
MPRYLVERLFHVSIDEMPKAGRRSKEVAVAQFPEITWEHSHVVVDDEGAVKTYASTLPRRRDGARHAEELTGRLQRISEIAGDVSPDDFP